MSIRPCFVALNAYPAIDPQVAGPIGGIETRSWMLARGLVKQAGLEVHFAVRHPEPLRQQSMDGVHLHLLRDRLYRHRESLALRLQRKPGFPWVGIKEPRLDDLLTIPLIGLQRLVKGKPDPLSPLPFFEHLPADLFLTFGVQRNSATVIASAHATRRPAILCLGSDSDLDDRYFSDEAFVSAYQDTARICRWTLQHADRILCQTELQLEKLKQLGREGTLLRNPIDFESWDAGKSLTLAEDRTCGLDRYALWVGRADSVHKRPLELLELARRTPQVNYLMIMNPRDDAVEAEVRRTLPANVRIVSQVPFAEMPTIMQRAAVLVNTSSLEGFPNTYLQATASGVPVGSLNVEPRYLRESRSGLCAEGEMSVLARFVEDCWQGTPTEFDASFSRAYIESRYSLDSISKQLAGITSDVAKELRIRK